MRLRSERAMVVYMLQRRVSDMRFCLAEKFYGEKYYCGELGDSYMSTYEDGTPLRVGDVVQVYAHGRYRGKHFVYDTDEGYVAVRQWSSCGFYKGEANDGSDVRIELVKSCNDVEVGEFYDDLYVTIGD